MTNDTASREAFEAFLKSEGEYFYRSDNGYYSGSVHNSMYSAFVAGQASRQQQPADVAEALRKCYVELQYCEMQLRAAREDYRSRDEMWDEVGSVYDALRAGRAALTHQPAEQRVDVVELKDAHLCDLLRFAVVFLESPSVKGIRLKRGERLNTREELATELDARIMPLEKQLSAITSPVAEQRVKELEIKLKIKKELFEIWTEEYTRLQNRITELEKIATCAIHDKNELARRNALLRQRDDLPVDRIPAHDELVRLQAQVRGLEKKAAVAVFEREQAEARLAKIAAENMRLREAIEGKNDKHN